MKPPMPIPMPGIEPGAGMIAAGPPIPMPIPRPGNIKFISISSGLFISSSAFDSSFFLMSSVLF
jgi:hypothetical protein